MPSGQGVVVSGANAQVTSKNFWPDGSLKFAIISGTAALPTANTPATITLDVGAASTGTALTLADLPPGLSAAINLTDAKDYSFDTAAQTIGANLVMLDGNGNPIAGTYVSHTVTANNGAAVASIIHTLNPDNATYTITAEISGGTAGNVQTVTFALNYLDLQGQSRSAVATVLAPVRTGGGLMWNGTYNVYKSSNVLPVTNASWSGADWGTPFDFGTGVSHGGAPAWVSGHRMSSWIYRKAITPHLTAWLEVRLYAGGAVEILPWVENGHLRVTNPTSATAAFEFTLNGSQRFSLAIDIPNHCRTVLVSGAALSYWLGADPAVTPKHNPTYFQTTRLVPKYGATLDPSSYFIANAVTTYTPFQAGDFPYPENMGSGGADPSIGLIPRWDVLCLVSGDTKTYANSVIHGYSAGRYGIHFRDETTNRPIKFTSYPNLVLDGSSNVSGTGASSTNSYTPTAAGTFSPVWATTHHPSVGYMAYLLTGRFYFMEQVQFSATIGYLKNTDTIRQTSKGLFLTDVGANTTRGAAWSIRTLTQAVCVTPDNDGLRADLLTSLQENVGYYYDTYVAQADNQFGFVTAYANYTPGSGKLSISPWQQDFVTSTFGFMLDVDLVGSTTKTELEAFFAWKAKSAIGRLGGTAITEFLYRDAAPYYLTVATQNPGQWLADWGAIYEATIGVTNPGNEGDLRGGNYPDATSYWGNLQPAIAYAVTHGVPGAQTAYDRMTGASNWSDLEASFISLGPEWSVVPNAQAAQVTTPNAAISKTYSIGSGQTLYAGRSKPVTPPSGSDPSWRSAMTPRTWATIGNSPSTIDPKNDAAINPNHASLPADAPWQVGASGTRFASIMDSWSGGAYNQDTDELYCMGEGHGDGGGNQIIAVALNVDSPVWRLETWPSGAVGNKLHPESTPGTEISVNDGLEATNAYADGRPRATHTYNNLLFANGDFYIAAQGAQWSSGNSGMYTFRYDANGTRDWTKLASRGASDQSFGAGCFDSSRNCIWYFPYAGNAPVRKYDIATNTWTSTGVSFPLLNDGYSRAVYIPTLDIIVCLSYQFSNDFRVFNPASPAIHAPPISGSVPTAGRYTGVWVPELGAVVTYEGGTGFNLLTPPATTPITGTWTWSRLEAAVENAVTPSSPASNGTYGRFFYAPSLQCFGVINSTDQQLHVFALS